MRHPVSITLRKKKKKKKFRVQARSRGGGELDSQEVRLSFAGPVEIKRREVVLDPQDSPEEINSREVELG